MPFDVRPIAPVVYVRCGKGNRITLLPTQVGSYVGCVDGMRNARPQKHTNPMTGVSVSPNTNAKRSMMLNCCFAKTLIQET